MPPEIFINVWAVISYQEDPPGNPPLLEFYPKEASRVKFFGLRWIGYEISIVPTPNVFTSSHTRLERLVESRNLISIAIVWPFLIVLS